MTGWTAVTREVNINYDLENSPLQIRTKSEIGSNEKVRVFFYNAQDEPAGGVILIFSSPPQYKLGWCSTSYNFPTTLPSGTDKVWTITLTRSSGVTPSVVIHCNNKEVLNVVLSDSECYSISNWRDYWSRNVEKIKFDSYDTASDYYRPGKVMTSCVLENYLDREVYPVQIYYTF